MQFQHVVDPSSDPLLNLNVGVGSAIPAHYEVEQPFVKARDFTTNPSLLDDSFDTEIDDHLSHGRVDPGIVDLQPRPEPGLFVWTAGSFKEDADGLVSVGCGVSFGGNDPRSAWSPN
jgi:hypothetical protein